MAGEFTPTPGNQVLAGLARLYLKAYGDAGYYELPNLSNAFVSIEEVSSEDDSKRPMHEAGWKATITADLLNVRIKDFIAGGALEALQSNHIFPYGIGHDGVSVYNAAAISATDGWFGVKWEYTNDGDASKHQFIRLTFKRFLTDAEHLLFISAAPTLGTPTGTDELDPFGELVYTDLINAGMRLVEFSAAGADTWSDSIDSIRASKFTAELLTEDDDTLRPRGYGVKLNVECELMQGAVSEQTRMAGLAARRNDVRLTLMDTNLVTFTEILGQMFSFLSNKNADGPAIIKMTAAGNIPMASWVGIWPALD